MKEFLNKKYTTTNGKMLLSSVIVSVILTIILTIIGYKLLSVNTLANLISTLNSLTIEGNQKYIGQIIRILIPLEFIILEIINMGTMIVCLKEEKNKETKKVTKKRK